MERTLKQGDHVVFKTEHRELVHALVTEIHGGGMTIEQAKQAWGNYPCINLLYVSTDENRRDPYGQQIERKSSVPYGAAQTPPMLGYCWSFPDEVEV